MNPVTADKDAKSSPMELDTDSWSLPLLIVEKVVSLLKRTRRWRLDGASLRLLNKRWSRQIDQYIEQIRPHFSRALTSEDAASLLKFPRLTSLDIRPFLPGAAATSKLRFQPFVPVNVRLRLDREFGILLESLTQLPNLRHLEVETLIAVTLDELQREAVVEEWPKLESVTSVHFYTDLNPKLYGECLLNMTWTLQQRAINKDSCFLRQLLSFIDLFPCLETLDAYGLDMAYLCSLKGLDIKSLRYMRRREPSIPPANCSSVEGIDARVKPPHDLGTFLEFDRLEFLAINIRRFGLNVESAFISFEKLRVLHLGNRTTVFMREDIFCALRSLESLSLKNISFDGVSLKRKLPHLKALQFRECFVRDGTLSFLSDMRHLRYLLFHRVSHGANILNLFKPAVELPDILSLSIDGAVDHHTLGSVARLTQLEVLSVDLSGRGFGFALPYLEKLSNLRVLGAVLRESRECLVKFFPLGLLTRLERLFLYCPPAASRLKKALPRRAPKLILECDPCSINQLGRSYFL